MSQKRLSMRKIRELLCLKYELGRSHREIAASPGVANSTVSDYASPAREAGLSWPLPEGLDDALEAAVFPPLPPSRLPRPGPDWGRVPRELRRHKGVTLRLLWLEYRTATGTAASATATGCGGGNRTWSCARCTGRARRRSCTTRARGSRSWTGTPGEVWDSVVFVGVLAASNHTFVDVTRRRSLPDWTASHVRMFEFFGGVPELVIPDNEKAGVRAASRYEPDLNPAYQELATHYGARQGILGAHRRGVSGPMASRHWPATRGQGTSGAATCCESHR